jgi:hypothetical protein
MAGGAPAAQQEVYLWPCNYEAWRHWQALQTQWRIGGMGGASGLDYAGVRAYLDESGLRGATRKEVWAGICACEAATLEGWAQQRADKPG